MICGVCGDGFAKVSETQFGCSYARTKGKALCTNMATISQNELESLILDAPQNNLMDPNVTLGVLRRIRQAAAIIETAAR
jgi:hypothetical protein